VSAPDPLLAATLLRRLAVEVARGEAALLGIEGSVLPIIAGDGAGRVHPMLQHLDLVMQSLCDIARVLDGLAAQMPGDLPLDAAALLDPLRLHDLALRLAGQQVTAPHPDDRISVF